MMGVVEIEQIIRTGPPIVPHHRGISDGILPGFGIAPRTVFPLFGLPQNLLGEIHVQGQFRRQVRQVDALQIVVQSLAGGLGLPRGSLPLVCRGSSSWPCRSGKTYRRQFQKCSSFQSGVPYFLVFQAQRTLTACARVHDSPTRFAWLQATALHSPILYITSGIPRRTG